MHNPFAEIFDESTDCDLIEQSKNGSQSAIEKLILWRPLMLRDPSSSPTLMSQVKCLPI
jgi:hypothetical protein